MRPFTEAELAYIAEGKLGRLATIDPEGFPHAVPLGWGYNAELGTFDLGGRAPETTQKWRNVQRNPKVALVIDDVLPPWKPRFLMVRGTAVTIDPHTDADGTEHGALIRLTPEKVVSFGLEG